MIFKKWGRGTLLLTLCILCLAFCLCACGSDATDDSGRTAGNDSSALPADHSGLAEDNTPSDPIERLSGRYYIDGDKTGSSVEVDADGRFTAYYASGTVEQTGYVRYEADNPGEKTFYVYVFYTDEGKPYMGFVDSGESRISAFETGNGDYRYVRVD